MTPRSRTSCYDLWYNFGIKLIKFMINYKQVLVFLQLILVTSFMLVPMQLKALTYAELTNPGRVLGESDLVVYPYSTGSLVNDSGTIYFISGKIKIPFTNYSAFRGLGYSLKNVIKGNLSNYTPAQTYQISTANAGHPWGGWVSHKGTIYYTDSTGLIGVPNFDVFLNNGGNLKFVAPANKYDIEALNLNPNLAPLTMADSRVFNQTNLIVAPANPLPTPIVTPTPAPVTTPSPTPTLTTNTVSIISPSANSTLVKLQSYNITWTGAATGNINIYLFKGDRNKCFFNNSGELNCNFSVDVSSPISVAENVPNNGNYLWTIPQFNDIGNNFRIVITDTNKKPLSSADSGYFSIAASGTSIIQPTPAPTPTPTMSVVNPSVTPTPAPTPSSVTIKPLLIEPSSAIVGQYYNGYVAFDYTSKYQVYAKFSGLPNGIVTQNQLGPNTGSATFVGTLSRGIIKMSGTPTQAGTYNINVTFTDYDSVDVTKQFTFIVNPAPVQSLTPVGSSNSTGTVTVVSPNGGENLTMGSTYTIKWTNSNNIDKVSISLIDGGQILVWSAPALVDNTGSYQWTVPSLTQSSGSPIQYKVAVLGYQTGVGNVQDYSDGYFFIK